MFWVKTSPGVASIGYWVAPWGRGAGAASAALRLVTDELHAMGGVVAVTTNIAEANVASRRTVEACGFTVSCTLPLECRDNGLAVDALTYRLRVGDPTTTKLDGSFM